MKKPARYTCKKHETCDLDTDQPALFEAHMKAKGHGVAPRTTADGTPATTPPWKKLPKRLWTGPKLTEHGKPFAPTGLEPGATVTWKQLVPTGYGEHAEWVDRTGQVWSRGPYPKSARVVPFDEIPDEAEVAVLVRESGLSDKLYHSQTYAPARQAA